jgi:hypothetical protein
VIAVQVAERDHLAPSRASSQTSLKPGRDGARSVTLSSLPEAPRSITAVPAATFHCGNCGSGRSVMPATAL